uniref:Uncharacterized protein n=1 Tax=Anguilla anguilla TaxID=7936 RepID=A0A0E9WHL3_ANGAN
MLEINIHHTQDTVFHRVGHSQNTCGHVFLARVAHRHSFLFL